MKQINNKLIYLNNGNVLHFYYCDEEGICMRSQNGAHSLLKDVHKDFDVVCLGSVIYLVCQNNNADIILLKYFDDAWHKYTLLVSKTQKLCDKNFYLLTSGECVLLFYTIKSSGRLLLIQQILSAQNSEPIVVAAIHSCAQPFFAINDNELNTYIYYQNEQGVLGYRMYKWSLKSFGEFVKVEDSVLGCIYTLSDMYGRHHICCKSQNSITYIKRSLDGEYTKTSIPVPYFDIDTAPYIHFDEEKIYIIWCAGGCIMYTQSTDDGESFCSPIKMISPGEVPVLFSVQNQNRRSFSFGTLINGEHRLINIGTHTREVSLNKNTAKDKRPIIREKTNSPDNEIKRIKSALAALCAEVSELKNKLELVMGLLEK